MHFAFGRRNYMLLIAGIVLMIIGFWTLSGGGSENPDVFSPDLFSPRRMVVAPMILLLGYVTVAVAILLKPKDTVNVNESTATISPAGGKGQPSPELPSHTTSVPAQNTSGGRPNTAGNKGSK